MTNSRVAVITGANKGVGYAIVRQLALQYPASPLNTGGALLVYLTARDRRRGEAAVQSLRQDAGLRQAGVFVELGETVGGKREGKVEIEFGELDISVPGSVQRFRDFLKERHPEGIDAVVNNAGIAGTGFDVEVVKTTLRCNYYGTLEATRAFLPLMRQDGRVVNVSSVAGSLNRYSPAIRSRFTSATTVDDVTAIMEDFTTAVAESLHAKAGFPGNAYGVSKAGITAFTGVIAKEAEKEGKGVLVNSCCPGWVNTDMTKGKGTKTPDEGAQTPVMLAIADIGGKVGKFWQHEKVRSW